MFPKYGIVTYEVACGFLVEHLLNFLSNKDISCTMEGSLNLDFNNSLQFLKPDRWQCWIADETERKCIFLLMPISYLYRDLKPVYYPLFAAEVLQKLCQELIEQIAKGVEASKNTF